MFTDEHLQTLIEKGLEQNTDLHIARLRVEEAEAVLKNARLSYLPSVSLSPEGGINRYDGVTAKTYNLGASASWEIDIFGKVTNAKRGAWAALNGSWAYQQAVQTQLMATIANSYYMLLMLDRQLAINNSTLVTWEKSIKVLEALKQSGKSNDAAVLQARANRMALESSVLSLRQSIHETENALSTLLAMPVQAIERGTLDGQRFPEELSVGVPLQLLANRPDVKQAEYNLAQAFLCHQCCTCCILSESYTFGYARLDEQWRRGNSQSGEMVARGYRYYGATTVQQGNQPCQSENCQSTAGRGNLAVPTIAA